ncbi:TetR family transcriptional regulator [Nocardia terpenica]|uniref:TetR family transcriptional regulator n=1 Tax=Nocardia terpenica TaxID=455432 RepID=A0A164PS12_9NOCA|nr:TetR family transcriptional regulator [Nocardia terpenica]KZM75987.1 TetR family transcriptional regulator [Nocardia terpenica]MBF6061901.1 TetR family transcriptional regulator [Nocardia terpenica]MBF6106298.1 TetR family transcriptional regulator [Nocardia terpenica]MBF6110321.1 TetR family transcriptional regulator [Nocardia terpenica]MBF6120842.1 TetR family transcriptional regulator [Nocardia terpenica]
MTSRDPEATKARIFAAATEEFAAHGIAGARVDRIARNAKANKQLIYAYFGDKQQLFQQVLEKAMLDVAAAVSTDIDDIDAWVDAHLEYHLRHPEFLRLQMWEALELLPDRITAGEMRANRYRDKVSKIDAAQQRGLLRTDVPPEYLLLLLTGLINYRQALPQSARFALGGTDDPEQWRAWLKNAVRRVTAPEGSAAEGIPAKSTPESR